MIIKSNTQTGVSTLISNAGLGQPARIIIADSDAAFISSLGNHLVAQPGFNVVAKVESCADALIW